MKPKLVVGAEAQSRVYVDDACDCDDEWKSYGFAIAMSW